MPAPLSVGSRQFMTLKLQLASFAVKLGSRSTESDLGRSPATLRVFCLIDDLDWPEAFYRNFFQGFSYLASKNSNVSGYVL